MAFGAGCFAYIQNMPSITRFLYFRLFILQALLMQLPYMLIVTIYSPLCI